VARENTNVVPNAKTEALLEEPEEVLVEEPVEEALSEKPEMMPEESPTDVGIDQSSNAKKKKQQPASTPTEKVVRPHRKIVPPARYTQP
jgi:hypothetical protein